MARDFDVMAMGNAIVDVLAPVDDAFLLTHKIAKGVMTLIDEYRANQLYHAFGERREAAGGSAANTMAGLASLGGRPLFLGRVKTDRLGETFAASLKDNGVSFAATPVPDGPPTACSLIAVAPDGQRSMNTHLGAARELSPDDIDPSHVASASVLYIEGYLWDSPSARAASQKAIAIAKKAGTQVAFTLSDPFCVGRYRDDFLELLGNDLDIVFANEEEAKALFEVDAFDEALQRFGQWNGLAALTRSAKGCVVTGGGEIHVIDAAPVEKVIDTTGAGDQFAAGFLFGHVRHKSLATCGKLGAMAAAEVISHYGARPETSLEALAAKAGLL
ncbi:MAG: adenosine kinase [Alphaproteobacteria bacterium]|nr:adenosine kinase [Alphaproteobacteria bacterium]